MRSNQIKQVIERAKKAGTSNPQLESVAKKLIDANTNNGEEQKQEYDTQKMENLEKLKLQIVAANDAEVEQMQRNINEQMEKEKEDMEKRMRKRRDEIMGDKKKNLDSRMKEMSG